MPLVNIAWFNKKSTSSRINEESVERLLSRNVSKFTHVRQCEKLSAIDSEKKS